MTTLSPEISSSLEKQGIELPSWAFGNSGTRFKVFATPGIRATRSRRSRMPLRSTV